MRSYDATVFSDIAAAVRVQLPYTLEYLLSISKLIKQLKRK